MPDRSLLATARLTGAALAAASVVVLWLWRGQTVGNPIVCAEHDGPFHVLKFLRLSRLLGPRLASIRTIERPHALLPQWIMERILISPDSARFAVEEVELIAGSQGVDMTVTLYDMDGRELFFSTDNFFPSTVYLGTDPAAPLSLRLEQEVWDGFWEEEKLTNPAAPRPVITGRFSDDDGVGSIRVAGWLANGDMALMGRAPLRFSFPNGSSPVSPDFEDWWGIVSPVAGGLWAYSAKGAGALPHALVSMPPKQHNVALAGGQIMINGHAEGGFAPIIALDGPYLPANA
ncbi:hypothetical protein FJQ54_16400 [Sandaracinobacter neustonicus]|uniref:Uncharacterized protein n=1 Tax=Sandaracinobacter neustonicus TaxID=1715348 RepID=A0A501XEA5_9SPHN|nr:hypothetical protein [Sandaracinobacter neustonicus]TPE58633.1 hypothetical protein FJQ54_16400 [Sandaracinobacter neustonicus]